LKSSRSVTVALAVVLMAGLTVGSRGPSGKFLLAEDLEPSILVALLAALLIFGRYQTSSMLRDLALVQAFVVLAVASLLPNVLPAVVETGPSVEVLRLRLFLVCGILASASMALAALAGDTRFRNRQVPLAFAVGAALVTPTAGIILLDLLRIQSSETYAARSLLGLAGALYALAVLGFRRRPAQAVRCRSPARRRRRRRDPCRA